MEGEPIWCNREGFWGCTSMAPSQLIWWAHIRQSGSSIHAEKCSRYPKLSRNLRNPVWREVYENQLCGVVFKQLLEWCLFLGVETNEILMPFAASFLESSRNGSMWPKASHGNTIT
ncbi:hypothetical protein Ccrd_010693 [Cynara cardunculus var. scolymus]|uniref:Uncharacterized protein n=1 Tax=Cynara cardunculus var. scolymus TaxID=59895 RepID=A0A103YKW1_CYNCS|nr:hypothetical protein Ccrd_010693 [Cynara cardunculus var. scolymus]